MKFPVVITVLAMAVCVFGQSPNTTTVPPKTTTPASTTSTIAPITTTKVPPKTTTTSTTTSTTTTTTSTTVAPVTTPKPTPMPEPIVNKWSLNRTDITCIIVEMAARFNVTTKTQSWPVDIPRANLTNVLGSCNNATQFIQIRWPIGAAPKDTYALTLNFATNASEHDYRLANITLAMPVAGMDNVVLLVHNVSVFTAPLENSYRCEAVNRFNFTGAGVNAVAAISHLQVEAYRGVKTHEFSSAKDCLSASGGTDLVPIIFGIALVTLILCILGGFLYGRRNGQRGYASM